MAPHTGYLPVGKQITVMNGGYEMRALLMDFGGVVFRSAFELLPPWAVRAGLPIPGARSGPFGTEPDELWERMNRQEITERDYWAARADEFGALLGKKWTSTDLITAISSLPEAELVRAEALTLARAARRANLPIGILTNDLALFHGPGWAAQSPVIREFDTVIDGSLTGVLKPDPCSYKTAADALRVQPADLVFLDDMPWNVDGARQLGANAFEVNIVDPNPAFQAAARALDLTEAVHALEHNRRIESDSKRP